MHRTLTIYRIGHRQFRYCGFAALPLVAGLKFLRHLPWTVSALHWPSAEPAVGHNPFAIPDKVKTA